nr:hypothetical protein [Rhizobium indicum]
MGSHDPTTTTGSPEWESVQHYAELSHEGRHLLRQIVVSIAFGEGSLNIVDQDAIRRSRKLSQAG